MDYSYILKDHEKKKVFSRVIAHLMGDGCVTNRYLGYYNKDPYLLESFERDIVFLFGDIHLIKGKVNSGTSLVQVQNKNILDFLRELVPDFRSFSLFFPRFIDSRECKIEFLKAIYDDEGSVGLRVFNKTNEIKRNLTIASKSKKFILDIKGVLENDFKIKCNKIGYSKKAINEKTFITWNVSITGRENFVKFRENISFNAPKKIKKLDMMINSYVKR
jgi:hypothetical protein